LLDLYPPHLVTKAMTQYQRSYTKHVKAPPIFTPM